MPEITAEMVKELREKTGAGLMDCKRALAEQESDGVQSGCLPAVVVPRQDGLLVDRDALDVTQRAEVGDAEFDESHNAPLLYGTDTRVASSRQRAVETHHFGTRWENSSV